MNRKGFYIRRAFVIVVILIMSFVIFLPRASASDMGVHITSPTPGTTISDQNFSVQGTFDISQSNKFSLIVNLTYNSKKIRHIYSFSVENTTTWGPIQVFAKDFENLPTKHICDITLQVATATPQIPPLQSDVLHLKWGVKGSTSINPPGAPKNVMAEVRNNESIAVSWKPSAQGTYPIAGYAIYRGTTPGGESATPIATVSANTTAYTDTNVTQGYTYYYYVKAFDNQNPPNYSTPSNEVSIEIKQSDTMPPEITILSPNDGAVVDMSALEIKGKVVDKGSGVGKVTVNGNAIFVSNDGSFDVNINLEEGLNTITITAVDKAGNKAVKTLQVTYKKENPSKPKKEITINLQINNPFMVVNGVSQEIDPGRGTKPVIIPKWGRTVVPIRAIVEALGGTIGWDGKERKVTIKFNGTTIELWIDKPKAKVNGATKWIDNKNHDVKPIIINDRTMLPLRFVVESLGCKVEWYPKTKAITITFGG